MTKTYIENEFVPQIPEEYSEENLRKKFAERQEELWKEIEDNLEYYNKLRGIEKETAESKYGSAYFPEEDLNKELRDIRTQTENYRKENDSIREEAKLLQKYGTAFARLYYIKEQHEIKGYDEKLSFTEVDITGNGDIITDSQHYGMSFNPEGRLTQPALVVKVDDEIEFNVGMMEFNKPNSAPEVKLQISFDEETADNLDAGKLNAIFDFCEKHGISSSDMVVRRFDGTIDDVAVQEKLQTLLAEREAQKAELEAKADREEYEAQKLREKELVKDIENFVKENGKELPKGLSLNEAINEANKLLPKDKQLNRDDISADLPLEDKILGAEREEKAPVSVSFKNAHLKKFVQKSEAVPDEKSDDTRVSAEKSAKVAKDDSRVSASAPDSSVHSTSSVTVPTPSTPVVTKSATRAVTQAKAEEVFENLFEEGLARKRNYSYFKTHTGLLGTGWTEYIIYDTEDRSNYRNDAREDKNGNVRYNYNFKFFIKQDAGGKMHFAYRTPHHKPLSEDIAGGIAGKFKDLGYTHIRFPKGVPDKEKGIWRKALAEKGIVPVGMGLDRSKAEGMIKAAKEKLSSEEFSNFKYRLALQMDKHNKEKGKKVAKSEQDFIDGLLLARKYEAFSSGYAEILKGKITRLVHPEEEKENGAVLKIGAMGNLRRLFNVFKDGVETGNILNSRVLTDRERQIISEHPGLLGNPSQFTGGQFAALYDIMLKESCDAAKIELEKKFREPGAKRAHEAIKQGEFNAAYNSCKSIIKELKSLGVDEIDLPETTSKLPYNAPDLSKTTPTPTPTRAKADDTKTASATPPVATPVAAAHSFDRGER